MLLRPLCLVLLVLLVLLACAPGGVAPEGRQRLDTRGSLEAQAAKLERARGSRPGSIDTRIELGTVYYLLARDALDGQADEGRYLAYLERAVEEFVTAVELDPRHEAPHFYLAVMDTYRGDLRGALRGFNNVKRLSPTPISYTNIAEIYVYRGRPDRAREWNRLGLRKGAPYGAVTFNDMLIAWKEGDVGEARRRFRQLEWGDPDMLRTINVARLPRAPRSFEEFAGYCCGSPACGPYMKQRCVDLALPVQERAISEEAVLKELRLEIEARRRMRKVYEQRKELEIEIGEPE